MSDFGVGIDWEAAARAQKAYEDSIAAAEKQAILDQFTPKQDLGKISGLPTNPLDPNSASLAYNQGAYLADGHYGTPVWQNGQIVGYDFVQHDVTPGMMSNIKTDLQGNVASRAVTPEGDSITLGDVARMALTMYGVSTGLGSLFGGAGLGAAGAAGAGVTDAAFLAADAAQLAAQGLTESQIASTLGSYGSSAASNLAASMAANGLDAATMTQQLGNLGTNTGLMSQTGSSADFLAADALQLQGQVGNNFAAIEQNLIASGVDPLVAADISQQLAFNPGLTQADLATNLSKTFGNNIYDVNMATTYPTSSLPGSGGLLNDVAGASTATPAVVTTPSAGSTITPGKILDAVKLGTVVAGIGGAAAGSGQTGFDIVPVPSDWTTPTYGQPIGQAPGLAPIDFGSRELLRGTQWEKYLNPAQPTVVPAPQTGMNYNQLMNTLQGGQGGSLSLNDIISGIQGQYGQTPSGTVG